MAALCLPALAVAPATATAAIPVTAPIVRKTFCMLPLS
jgi:hypothetical protein